MSLAACCLIALPAAAQGRAGGFVPGQQRPPGDPTVIARGKAVYGINCTGCHGADLRGGDLGGPNLLRSQVALTDQNGELITPIVEHGRGAMPAIPVSPDDAKAVAAYIRSVVATIGRQGKPPDVGVAPADIVTGDAAAGRAFFDSKCAGCHSPTGDLQGIATRIPDPRMLQNAWVSGSSRGGRGRGAANGAAIIAVIAQPNGAKIEGRLQHIDDFLVSITLDDGTTRSFRRDGDSPKIELRDPLKAHRDLLTVLTDKEMHDVTAYLVTLK
jgi:cytochrome c oxidase cbb3-type subunit III